MVDLVKQQQKLNDIKLELPKAPIKNVVNNPKQFALDFAELYFLKNIKRYIQAYKLGEKFAETNLKKRSKLNE